MVLGEGIERLTIDILHEDGIVGHGDIPHEVRMFEVITRLKLLPQGCDITRVGAQRFLQSLQEMEFSVEAHQKAIAGGAADLQFPFYGKRLLGLAERRVAAVHFEC